VHDWSDRVGGRVSRRAIRRLLRRSRVYSTRGGHRACRGGPHRRLGCGSGGGLRTGRCHRFRPRRHRDRRSSWPRNRRSRRHRTRRIRVRRRRELRRHSRLSGLGRLRGLGGRRHRRLCRWVGMGLRRNRRQRRDRGWLRRARRAVGWRWFGIGRRSGRKQRERIDVSLLVVGATDAEVHVGLVPSRLTARPDGRNRRSFHHRIALADEERAQVLQGHGVAVRRANRQGLPARGHRPGERHHAGRRGRHVGAKIARDVDPPVLPAGVGIIAENERPQDRSVRRPRPRLRRGRDETGRDDQEHEHTTHRRLLVHAFDNIRRSR
jgi:hypothetical protein